jgi:hypothetical protein
MEDDDEKTLRHVITIINLVMLVPLLLWDAVAASVLWRWFVVTHFALPVIGVIQMGGLVLAIRYIRGMNIPETEGNTQRSIRVLACKIFGPAIAMLSGAILRACGA